MVGFTGIGADWISSVWNPYRHDGDLLKHSNGSYFLENTWKGIFGKVYIIWPSVAFYRSYCTTVSDIQRNASGGFMYSDVIRIGYALMYTRNASARTDFMIMLVRKIPSFFRNLNAVSGFVSYCFGSFVWCQKVQIVF